MENHPFVVAGLGLLAGAVIASALPVSEAENRVFGDTSDDLKNRARDVAQFLPQTTERAPRGRGFGTPLPSALE